MERPEPMMLPFSSASGSAPYDEPRGTCPACGSSEVIHLVIGMPAHLEDVDSGPDWVHWVGCVHPGWERECAACGARWWVKDGEVVLRRDLR